MVETIVMAMIVCAFIGVIAWVLTALFNPPEPIRRVIIGVAVLGCLLYVAIAFGIIGGGGVEIRD